MIVHGRPSARRSRSSFRYLVRRVGRPRLRHIGAAREAGWKASLLGRRCRETRAELSGLASRDTGSRSSAVAGFAAANAAKIDFQCWLQWLMEEQLAGTQQASLRAGMALGVMHDLPVGVSTRGADAWSLRDSYARSVSVGCPPDPFNQQGQDWAQPPWRPDRLAATAYESVPGNRLNDLAACGRLAR